MRALGDPLALYKLPRESQLLALGLRWLEVEDREAAAGRPLIRTRQAVEPLPLGDPDPEHGRTLSRPLWLQAVSAEARERADRFRVS